VLRLEDGQISNILEKFGQMPLPPYIAYEKGKEKAYQPVLAQEA